MLCASHWPALPPSRRRFPASQLSAPRSRSHRPAPPPRPAAAVPGVSPEERSPAPCSARCCSFLCRLEGDPALVVSPTGSAEPRGPAAEGKPVTGSGLRRETGCSAGSGGCRNGRFRASELWVGSFSRSGWCWVSRLAEAPDQVNVHLGTCPGHLVWSLGLVKLRGLTGLLEKSHQRIH